jgi:ubiquinone/menaquinone biosynthesis C-methylase UbiE
MSDSERRSRSYYDGAAWRYDWSNRIGALLRGASDIAERRKAIAHLNLKPGHRVLEVSSGTGMNLQPLAERVGRGGHFVGLDISPGMLARCRQKLRHSAIEAGLVEGEASHLPFANGAFHAVFHHGGLAEFGDRKGAIEEMMRVARPGATIVICDVGVPSDRKLSLMNRLLLRLQPLYAKHPPMELIPPEARNVRLSWFRGGGWYLIEFTNP